MADLIFGSDTITNMPASGSSITIGPVSAPYTFSPFATAQVVDDNTASGSGTVTLVLSLSNITPASSFTNGETLISVVNGTTNTQFVGANGTVTGGNATFIGSFSDATTFLQTAYVVDTSNHDRFRLSLSGTDDEGGATGNFVFSYRLTCFVRGTMVATPEGERAVESLQIGDLVTTLDGSAKPVKWVGHRTYEAEFGAAEAFVRPVLFRAGSLGGGLPVRDLRVSPQHGMLIDGVMVPAASLVNGVSILRDTTVQDTQYFHVELDGHAAIFSEGAPSETYIDIESRAMFDNADEYGLLYGASEPVASSFDRVEEGWQVAAIRARLAKLAGVELQASSGGLKGRLESLEDGVLKGWVAAEQGEAVEAEVLVDGEVVGTLVANRYRSDLDQAGIMGGRCAFTMAMPASAVSLEQVGLRRITDGSMIGTATYAFAAG